MAAGGGAALDLAAESPEGFTVGAIKRLVVEDFMVHRRLEMNMSPRLNLVIGPNGSGKSTVVAALALGLAGNPKVMGRAKTTEAYIRHGADKAVIQITMQGDPAKGNPDVVIERTLNRGSADGWRLNQKAAKLRDVKQRVQDRFNIRVDNLTQFLPQERIAEFTTLDKRELLVATEKTIDPSLFAKHEQLKKDRKDRDEVAALLEQETATANSLRGEVASLEGLVLASEDVRKLDEKISDLKKYLPWTKYSREHLKAKQLQCQVKNLKAQVKAAQRVVPRLDQARAEARDVSTRAEREANAARKKVGRSQEQLAKVLQGLRGSMSASDSAASAVQQVVEAADNAEAKLKKQRARIAKIEQEVGQVDPEATKAEITSLHERRHEVLAEQDRLRARREQVRERMDDAEDQLKVVRSKLQQIAVAKKRFSSALSTAAKSDRAAKAALRAAQWLSKAANRQQLSGQVLGPICKYVRTMQHDPVQAKVQSHMLSNAVGKQKLFSFVLTKGEDQEVLMSGANRAVWENVALIEVANPSACPATPASTWRGLLEQIEGETLDDFLKKQGIDPYVRAALRSTARSSEKALGGSKAEALLASGKAVVPPSLQAISTRGIYSCLRAKTLGDGQVRLQFRGLRATGGVIVAAVDDRQFRELTQQQEELTRQVAEIRLEDNAITTEERQLRSGKYYQEQITALRAKLTKHKKSRERLQAAQAALARLQKEGEKEYLTDLKKAYLRSLATCMASARAIPELHERFTQLGADLDEALLAAAVHEVATRRAAQVAEVADEAAAKLSDMAEKRLKLKDKLATAKTQLAELRAKAAQEVDILDDPEGQALYQRLTDDPLVPSKYEELGPFIRSLEAQRDGMEDYDPNLKKDLEEKTKAFERTQLGMQAQRIRLDALNASIEELKEHWTAKLQVRLRDLSRAFQALFASLHIRGEVHLYEDPEGDFSKYGVQIMVAFRAGTELQELSAHTQSGGERAVSTMMYLMAMQRHTPCPFRVIDEMNQGMDAANERSVFRAMMGVCAPGKTARKAGHQYFVITPKLLPNLRHAEHVRTHFIYNGPCLQDSRRISLQQYAGLKRRDAPAAGEGQSRRSASKRQ